MSPTRAAAAAILLFLVVVWLANAAGLGDDPTPRREAGDAAPAPHPIAVDIASQAAKLRMRLSAAPIPRPTSRNPFQFATRKPAAPARARESRVREAAPAMPALRTLAPRPQLALIGIAQDTPDAPRTAIVSALGQVFLLKTGGMVADRFRLRAVGADAAEFEDLQDGGIFTLPLR